ncbi:23094_t:CDS:2 [Gigaspora margarita]|uniref:23094_t:CDS:1 n=1 Tax=Gigaspora margarita TaxID=4874 RepID=A0ABM8VVM9_GIGMA|nr:23094_t:CDS:2 [Gigaspora margarita]
MYPINLPTLIVFEILSNEIFSYLETETQTLFYLAQVNRNFAIHAIPYLWKDPFGRVCHIQQKKRIISILLQQLLAKDLQFNKFLLEDITPNKSQFNYVSYCETLDTSQVANALMFLFKDKIIGDQLTDNLVVKILRITLTTKHEGKILIMFQKQPKTHLIEIVEIDISFLREIFLEPFYYLSQNISSLVLSISYIPSQLKEIFTSIGKNLKSLNISYLFHTECIPTIAENCPNLQEITFYSIFCGQRSCFYLEKFIPIFQNRHHLYSFNFYSNYLAENSENLQPPNTFVKIFSHFPISLTKLVILLPFYENDILEFFRTTRLRLRSFALLFLGNPKVVYEEFPVYCQRYKKKPSYYKIRLSFESGLGRD